MEEINDSKFIDARSRQCPYLGTINRNVLDFDFEKLCSITLSNNNVYACLVCGKYFQGILLIDHLVTNRLFVLNRTWHQISCLYSLSTS